MQEMELVSFKLCPYVQRSVIVLIEKQIPFRRIDIDLSDKPEWFKELSPLGRVPLLKRPGGPLFESAVICEYLDEITAGSLHPEDPLEKARHRSWIEFASSLLSDIGGFYNAADEAALANKRQQIIGKFQRLDKILQAPYFAGTEFTLVDAAFAPVFRYFDCFERVEDFGFFQGLDKVRNWRSQLRKRASVQDAVAPDFDEALADFMARRESALGQRFRSAKAA